MRLTTSMVQIAGNNDGVTAFQMDIKVIYAIFWCFLCFPHIRKLVDISGFVSEHHVFLHNRWQEFLCQQ